MKVALVLLSVFAVGMCAPVGDAAEHSIDEQSVDSGEDMRVKRAKEITMFESQQNDQKDNAKRGDPSIDKDGLIVAKEPIPLATTDSNIAVNEEDNSENVVTSDNEDRMIQSEIDETEEPPANAEETMETANSDETTSVEVVGDVDDNEDNQMSFDDYLKELEKLQGEDDNMSPYLNSLMKDTRGPYNWGEAPQYYPQNYNNYSPYGQYLQRYRRSQARALKNIHFPRARFLKRSHRTKRQAYYVPELPGYLPYEDKLLESPYSNYPMTEDDIAELLDLLYDPRGYDDESYTSSYDEYSPYEDMEDVQFESPIYMPKRQADLAYVPGIKRARDFFPYFKEPDTHYSAFVSEPAFVPEKRSMRDYADAYEKVMELAAALRTRDYYPEEYFEGYRRRK